MGTNHFGKTSKLHITSEHKESKTRLKDAYYTAPFKIMQPFYPQGDQGRMQIMALSASAGLMEGDRQEIDIHVKKDSKMELLSQSYEKIHKMPEGHASRETKIKVEKNALFQYHPLPVIPFADSVFQNRTVVQLEDPSSLFLMKEVLSCGRYAMGERYCYRYYQSLLQVYRGEQLIYMDNTCFEPGVMEMDGMGLMEGYHHLGNVLVFGGEKSEERLSKVQRKILEMPEIDGGATVTESGDLVIRLFGMTAQKVEEAIGVVGG